MAFSAGFSPHPKISYLGAAPTGAASEAEYLEIGLSRALRPRGRAGRAGRRAARRTSPSSSASRRGRGPARSPTGSTPPSGGWSCPASTLAELQPAVETFLASDVVTVAKRTKNGLKDIDAREAVTSASAAEEAGCAILHMVVRQLTPAVRPDDVLAALAAVADLHPPLPARAVREAQGRLDDSGTVADPLGPDRAARILPRRSTRRSDRWIPGASRRPATRLPDVTHRRRGPNPDPHHRQTSTHHRPDRARQRVHHQQSGHRRGNRREAAGSQTSQDEPHRRTPRGGPSRPTRAPARPPVIRSAPGSA